MREPSPGAPSPKGSNSSLTNGAVTRNIGFQQQNTELPWSSPAISLPGNCNSNLTSENQNPMARTISNASALTSLCADLSASDSHFFEVLYIGKVRISQRKVPESLIDDALNKFAQHEAEKALKQRRHSLLSSTGTSIYSSDSKENLEDENNTPPHECFTNNSKKILTPSTTPLEPDKAWASAETLSTKPDAKKIDEEFDMFTKERAETFTKETLIKKPTQTPLEPSVLVLNVPKNNLDTVKEEDKSDIYSVISETASSINEFCLKTKIENSKIDSKDHDPFLDKASQNQKGREASPAPMSFQEINRKPVVSERKTLNENKPFLRDRSASIGTINQKTPIAQLIGEQNRTMLFQVGRAELRLISPDRKQILLHRGFKDVASCVLGRINKEHFGFVCRETNDTYACYVFKCESDSVALELINAIKQAFVAHAELLKKSREKSPNMTCEHCPMLWYHRLCHDIEGMNDKKTHAFILRRIEQLPEDEQDLIVTKYQGGTNHMYETGEHNAFLMMLLRAHCEAKQTRHVHDTAENRSEFLNQYLGGSTIFSKARRSISSSFDLLKRKASRDEGIVAPIIKKESSPLSTPVPTAIVLDTASEPSNQELLSPEVVRSKSLSPAVLEEATPSPRSNMTPTPEECEDTAEAPVNSPMMDIFLKVSDNRPAPVEAGSENEATWRQAIYEKIVQPDVQVEGELTSMRKPSGPKGKRTKEELRRLWKMAIDQTILLVRMEKENARLKESEESSAVRRIKLEYTELGVCDAGVSLMWDSLLSRDPSQPMAKVDRHMLTQAVIQVPMCRRGGYRRSIHPTPRRVLARQMVRRAPSPTAAITPAAGLQYEARAEHDAAASRPAAGLTTGCLEFAVRRLLELIESKFVGPRSAAHVARRRVVLPGGAGVPAARHLTLYTLAPPQECRACRAAACGTSWRSRRACRPTPYTIYTRAPPGVPRMSRGGVWYFLAEQACLPPDTLHYIHSRPPRSAAHVARRRVVLPGGAGVPAARHLTLYTLAPPQECRACRAAACGTSWRSRRACRPTPYTIYTRAPPGVPRMSRGGVWYFLAEQACLPPDTLHYIHSRPPRSAAHVARRRVVLPGGAGVPAARHLTLYTLAPPQECRACRAAACGTSWRSRRACRPTPYTIYTRAPPGVPRMSRGGVWYFLAEQACLPPDTLHYIHSRPPRSAAHVARRRVVLPGGAGVPAARHLTLYTLAPPQECRACRAAACGTSWRSRRACRPTPYTIYTRAPPGVPRMSRGGVWYFLAEQACLPPDTLHYIHSRPPRSAAHVARRRVVLPGGAGVPAARHLTLYTLAPPQECRACRAAACGTSWRSRRACRPTPYTIYTRAPPGVPRMSRGGVWYFLAEQACLPPDTLHYIHSRPPRSAAHVARRRVVLPGGAGVPAARHLTLYTLAPPQECRACRAAACGTSWRSRRACRPTPYTIYTRAPPGVPRMSRGGVWYFLAEQACLPPDTLHYIHSRPPRSAAHVARRRVVLPGGAGVPAARHLTLYTLAPPQECRACRAAACGTSWRSRRACRPTPYTIYTRAPPGVPRMSRGGVWYFLAEQACLPPDTLHYIHSRPPRSAAHVARRRVVLPGGAGVPAARHLTLYTLAPPQECRACRAAACGTSWRSRRACRPTPYTIYTRAPPGVPRMSRGGVWYFLAEQACLPPDTLHYIHSRPPRSAAHVARRRVVLPGGAGVPAARHLTLYTLAPPQECRACRAAACGTSWRSRRACRPTPYTIYTRAPPGVPRMSRGGVWYFLAEQACLPPDTLHYIHSRPPRSAAHVARRRVVLPGGAGVPAARHLTLYTLAPPQECRACRAAACGTSWRSRRACRPTPYTIYTRAPPGVPRMSRGGVWYFLAEQACLPPDTLHYIHSRPPRSAAHVARRRVVLPGGAGVPAARHLTLYTLAPPQECRACRAAACGTSWRSRRACRPTPYTIYTRAPPGVPRMSRGGVWYFLAEQACLPPDTLHYIHSRPPRSAAHVARRRVVLPGGAGVPAARHLTLYTLAPPQECRACRAAACGTSWRSRRACRPTPYTIYTRAPPGVPRMSRGGVWYFLAEQACLPPDTLHYIHSRPPRSAAHVARRRVVLPGGAGVPAARHLTLYTLAPPQECRACRAAACGTSWRSRRACRPTPYTIYTRAPPGVPRMSRGGVWYFLAEQACLPPDTLHYIHSRPPRSAAHVARRRVVLPGGAGVPAARHLTLYTLAPPQECRACRAAACGTSWRSRRACRPTPYTIYTRAPPGVPRMSRGGVWYFLAEQACLPPDTLHYIHSRPPRSAAHVARRRVVLPGGAGVPAARHLTLYTLAPPQECRACRAAACGTSWRSRRACRPTPYTIYTRAPPGVPRMSRGGVWYFLAEQACLPPDTLHYIHSRPPRSAAHVARRRVVLPGGAGVPAARHLTLYTLAPPQECRACRAAACGTSWRSRRACRPTPYTIYTRAPPGVPRMSRGGVWYFLAEQACLPPDTLHYIHSRPPRSAAHVARRRVVLPGGAGVPAARHLTLYTLAPPQECRACRAAACGTSWRSRRACRPTPYTIYTRAPPGVPRMSRGGVWYFLAEQACLPPDTLHYIHSRPPRSAAHVARRRVVLPGGAGVPAARHLTLYTLAPPQECRACRAAACGTSWRSRRACRPTPYTIYTRAPPGVPRMSRGGVWYFLAEQACLPPDTLHYIHSRPPRSAAHVARRRVVLPGGAGVPAARHLTLYTLAPPQECRACRAAACGTSWRSRRACRPTPYTIYTRAPPGVPRMSRGGVWYFLAEQACLPPDTLHYIHSRPPRSAAHVARRRVVLPGGAGVPAARHLTLYTLAPPQECRACRAAACGTSWRSRRACRPTPYTIYTRAPPGVPRMSRGGVWYFLAEQACLPPDTLHYIHSRPPRSAAHVARRRVVLPGGAGVPAARHLTLYTLAPPQECRACRAAACGTSWRSRRACRPTPYTIYTRAPPGVPRMSRGGVWYFLAEQACLPPDTLHYIHSRPPRSAAHVARRRVVLPGGAGVPAARHLTLYTLAPPQECRACRAAACGTSWRSRRACRPTPYTIYTRAPPGVPRMSRGGVWYFLAEQACLPPDTLHYIHSRPPRSAAHVARRRVVLPGGAGVPAARHLTLYTLAPPQECRACRAAACGTSWRSRRACRPTPYTIYTRAPPGVPRMSRGGVWYFLAEQACLPPDTLHYIHSRPPRSAAHVARRRVVLPGGAGVPAARHLTLYTLAPPQECRACRAAACGTSWRSRRACRPTPYTIYTRAPPGVPRMSRGGVWYFLAEQACLPPDTLHYIHSRPPRSAAHVARRRVVLPGGAGVPAARHLTLYTLAPPQECRACRAAACGTSWRSRRACRPTPYTIYTRAPPGVPRMSRGGVWYFLAEQACLPPDTLHYIHSRPPRSAAHVARRRVVLPGGAGVPAARHLTLYTLAPPQECRACRAAACGTSWRSRRACRPTPYTIYTRAPPGVPRMSRGGVWYFLAEQACLRGAPPDTAACPLYHAPYTALLAGLTKHQHAILIDLGRTFPKHSYFASALGPGQLALYNLLKAYSLLDPDVGYCQGLSFVAGVLLLHMEEAEAFILLRHLMFRRGLRKQYLPDMSALQVQLYQLSRLLRDHEPDLHAKLEALDISPALYAAPWMLTLFTSQFPLGFVVRVFDLIFLESLDIVFSVSLALLSAHKDGLMLCESCEEAAEYLKHKLPDMDRGFYEKVMKKVLSLDISRQLCDYAVEYAVLREEMPRLAALTEENRQLIDDKNRLGEELDEAMDAITNYQKTQTRLETQNKSLEQQLTLLSRYISAHHKQDIPIEIKKIVQNHSKKLSFKIFSTKFSNDQPEVEDPRKNFKTGISSPNLFAKIREDSPKDIEHERRQFMMKKSQSVHSGLIANMKNYQLKVLDEKNENHKTENITDSLKELGKKHSGFFASTHEQIRQERLFEHQLKNNFDENLRKLDEKLNEKLNPTSYIDDLSIFQSRKSMSLNLQQGKDGKVGDSGFVTPLSPDEKKEDSCSTISHPLSDVDVDIKFDGQSTKLKQIRPIKHAVEKS
uniref:Rab-GAP TBC domain-containing protein n=1 Tax=Heliothis virescens TaxID=7102 RepID=A0A2A4J9H3_HELVI